jgi:hypothetical protein
LLTGGGAAMLFGRWRWPRGDAFWWGFTTEAGMAFIALYALLGAILPQLGG